MSTDLENRPRSPYLLLVGFPSGDRTLFREAFREAHPTARLEFIDHPDDLIQFCTKSGKHASRGADTQPALILVELKVSPKTNESIFRFLKSQPDFALTPILAFSSLSSEKDCRLTYELGANSLITKPVTFESLVHVVKSIVGYWLDVVHLP